MNYTGTITDKKGNAIKNARVLFFLPSGAAIPYQATVDSNGDYLINTDSDGGLLDPANTVHFVAPGYYDYVISASQVPEYFRVWLQPQVSKEMFIGLGLAGTLALLMSDKKAVSKIAGDSREFPGWIVPTVAIVGVGFVVMRLFKSDKSEDAAKVSDAADIRLQQLRAQGITPTISAATAESMSSAIVQAADDCGTDEDAIYSTFEQLHNEADFWLLMKVYGVRSYKACFSGNWLWDTPYSLTQTIFSELSSWARSDLNDILAQRGINYQF